jgi:hypothetical protein
VEEVLDRAEIVISFNLFGGVLMSYKMVVSAISILLLGFGLLAGGAFSWLFQ